MGYPPVWIVTTPIRTPQNTVRQPTVPQGCLDILNHSHLPVMGCIGSPWLAVGSSILRHEWRWLDRLGPEQFNANTAICNTLTDSTMYANECMMMTITSTSAVNLPSDRTYDIQVYQPSLGLGQSDYTALCNIYSGVNCGNYDSDSDGGLCSNFQTILGFEDGNTSGAETPGLAHANTFSWDPSNGTSSCGLNGAPPFIYAIEKCDRVESVKPTATSHIMKRPCSFSVKGLLWHCCSPTTVATRTTERCVGWRTKAKPSPFGFDAEWRQPAWEEIHQLYRRL